MADPKNPSTPWSPLEVTTVRVEFRPGEIATSILAQIIATFRKAPVT